MGELVEIGLYFRDATFLLTKSELVLAGMSMKMIHVLMLS